MMDMLLHRNLAVFFESPKCAISPYPFIRQINPRPAPSGTALCGIGVACLPSALALFSGTGGMMAKAVSGVRADSLATRSNRQIQPRETFMETECMLLHKQSELWYLHFSPASSGASGWNLGQWFSSVDLEGLEKGQFLCNLNRLSFMCVCGGLFLSRYFILWHWHHIWPFPSDVRLSSRRLWKIETAAMQPVDWASVICIGGINERVQTHKWGCSAVQHGWWKAVASPSFYWEHHYERLLTTFSHLAAFSEICGWNLMWCSVECIFW